MTCSTSRWVLSFVFVIACGGDDGGDDTGNDTANDDETPASDDFAPQDADASESADDGSTDGDGTTGTDGVGSCVEAGQACGPTDYCNTWICTCNAGATEFMTVGSCDAGVCTAEGTAACEAICMNSGGVASAVDGGCG